MPLSSRLLRIERALDVADCPACLDDNLEAIDDPEAWAEAFFAPCAKCGRQRTWLDLIEAES